MASVKFYLKIYSLSLGFVVSFASFCWIALILYVLSQTDPGSTGLMLARYLDISFGLLAFTSSLALLYGAFVESKSWLSVWTLGSATVLVGSWVWHFYRKYGVKSPEALDGAQETMLGVSLGYAVSVLPVLLFYKYLESPDNFLKPCKKIRQGMIFAASGGGGGSDGAIPTTVQTSRYRDSGYRVAIPAEEDLFNPV